MYFSTCSASTLKAHDGNCLDKRFCGNIILRVMVLAKKRKEVDATVSKKSIGRILVTALLLVFVFSAVTFAFGEGEDDQLLIPDLLVGKPLGLLALGFGGVIYVVTLPVTLPFGWAGQAGETLVKKPYRFTFERGLGEDLDKP
jgi:hypothetical protein